MEPIPSAKACSLSTSILSRGQGRFAPDDAPLL